MQQINYSTNDDLTNGLINYSTNDDLTNGLINYSTNDDLTNGLINYLFPPIIAFLVKNTVFLRLEKQTKNGDIRHMSVFNQCVSSQSARPVNQPLDLVPHEIE
jgi:hypothetical protein